MTDSLSQKEGVEASIEVDIFTVSAALVGVCLTVIQLIKMNENQAAGSLADEVLACDSVLFLISCFFSYLALRFKGQPRRRHFLEKIAHSVFLLALASIVVVCALMAYSFF